MTSCITPLQEFVAVERIMDYAKLPAEVILRLSLPTDVCWLN